MLSKFTKHLEEQNETYFQHMVSAWRIIFLLKKIEIKCFVHSLLPFVYTNAVSSQIECLNKITNREKPPHDDELYEIYGGD
mgnify:CR=1 FL=1|tara:strand:+ start:712 stop:954 length:243 start_codon:yes stop_codon:yes gene_type:complete